MSRLTKSSVETDYDGNVYVCTTYQDDPRDKVWNSVSLSKDGVWLNMNVGRYDNNFMLHAEAIPSLIKAIRKAQRKYIKDHQQKGNKP